MHLRRTDKHQVANAVYASIAELLISDPSQFVAVTEGLAISSAVVDALLGSSIARSVAIAAAISDRYLIRATHSYWVLLPEAFDCADDCLPAGVRDCRGMSVRHAMDTARAA